MAYFINSNKPFLCERNKEKVFVFVRIVTKRRAAASKYSLPLWLTLEIVTNIFFEKETEQNSYFFQAEKKVCKKAAGREPLWASIRIVHIMG